MEFEYFSRNGVLRPAAEAVVPLSNIEYSYGFGVYETVRVSSSAPVFLADHVERLMSSAREIGLEHPFSRDLVARSLEELVAKNKAGTCNVKILLIGGRTSDEASLFILCLNPFFPDKRLYRDGASCIMVEYERAFPHAKTLNMLRSYLAYREAKEAGAYDALLIDSGGRITEGTRTNFFCIKDRTLYSPPEGRILLGVTRKAVLKVAKENGYILEERDIRPEDLSGYDGAFLTSTSSKIVPVRSVGEHRFKEVGPELRELMDAFDRFLEGSRGEMSGAR